MFYKCLNCNIEFKVSPARHKRALEYPNQWTPKACSMDCNRARLKGIRRSPGTMFKSEDLVGDKNINWKGGVSEVASMVRKINLYKEWRTAVYVRDDYTCQVCNEKGGVLNADHIRLFHHILADNNIKSIAEARACSELWNVDNGQTLCKSCHNEKTVTELDFVYKSENRMRGLNRAGGTPGRKWKPKSDSGV